MKVDLYAIELEFLREVARNGTGVAKYSEDWVWLSCVVRDANWRLLRDRLRDFLIEVDEKVIAGSTNDTRIPSWLSQRLGREPTEVEAESYMKTFFSTPIPARYDLVPPWGIWSPSGFMHWLTPESRQFLIREFVGGPDCEIRIYVADLPAALDAFEFLVAAAADVDVDKVRVHGI